MLITVAICTWNRADLLHQTLAAFHGVEVPAHAEWELLVVNNCCSDNTDEVIEEHRSHLPIRRLFERQMGLSNARNCALAAARGDLILWTDDDVIVASNWLTAYHQAARQYPDAGFFGGSVLPWFEGNPPRWLQRHWEMVEGVYAVRKPNAELTLVDRRLVPVGANFGVRTDIQRRYPFNPSLGPQGTSRIGGEETTLLRQMLADGVQGRWVMPASVQHFVPELRQTTRYVAAWYEGYGAYLAVMEGRVEGVHWFGKPRWLWRRVIMAGLRYYARRNWVPDQWWLRDLQEFATSYGQLRAYGGTGWSAQLGPG
jgi:glycosyltransferase involved in cell wall biosynthesis